MASFINVFAIDNESNGVDPVQITEEVVDIDVDNDSDTGPSDDRESAPTDQTVEREIGEIEIIGDSPIGAPSKGTQQDTTSKNESGSRQMALEDFRIEPLAAGLSSDLSQFITSVSMTDMSGNPVSSTTVTYIGQTYKFAVSFAETTTLQLQYDTNGVLTYQLPSNLNIATAVPQTPLYGNAPNNAIIGWYTIDTNGLVQMWFENIDLNGKPTPNNINFIDYYSNVNITFNVFAQLVGGSGSNINFGNGVSVNIVAPTDPPPSLTMVKSSQYDPTHEVINYTITITALGGSVSDLTLSDTPTLTLGTNTYDSFVGPGAYSGFTYMINGTMGPVTATPTWNSSPLTFSINNFVDTTSSPLILASGDTVTLSYSVDLEYVLTNNNGAGEPLVGQTPTNYNFTMDNTATAGGQEADNGTGLTPVSDSTTDHVNRDLALTKTGVYNKDTDTITWSLIVGDGYSLILNGGTITDTWSGGQTPPATNTITISLFSGPSSSTPAFDTGTADTFSTFVEDTNGFTFVLPDAPPDIYEVTIEFDTTVPPPQPGMPATIYNNVLDFTAPDGTDGTVTAQVPVSAPPVTITKTTEGICGNPATPGPGYWVDYTISVDVPGGLQGQQLYLFDDLGIFPAGDAVTHTPQNVNVSIVPSAAESGIAPLYSGPVQMYGNSWRIFFGSNAPVPDNVTVPSSTWQYNDPAVITVTYKVYISNSYISVLQSSPSASLQNAVYLINCTNDPVGQQYPDISPTGNSVGGVNTVDYWPIFKTVLGTSDPAIFAYTSSINGGVRVPSLLQTGSAPLFTDTFDSRMEYVSGTFYIYDSTTGTYYAPADDVVVSASGNSFSTYLNSTDWEVIDGPLPGANVISPAPTDWFATSDVLQAHYELELLAQNLGTEQTGLTNTALINVDTNTAGACSFNNTATTSYSPEILQKTMTPVSSGADQVYVDIIINETGGYVFSDGTGSAPDPVTAVDLLENLLVYTSTIQMYTQGMSGGVWDGSWVEVTPITFNDGAVWSVTVVPPAGVPTGYSGQLDFVIPNETPVRITYNALVDLPVGSRGPISNEISIFEVSDSDGNGQYVVGSQGVGVNAGRQDLRVFKGNDAGNNLSDAEFSLYVTDISDGYTPPSDLDDPGTNKVLTGSGGTVFDFGLVTDEINGLDVQTTDAGGVAVFSNEWINSSDDFLYLLVEESTPTGFYNLSPYTFVTLNPSITQANVNSLNSLLGPILLTGQSVDRISDFTNIMNFAIGLNADSLRIVKEFYGLTDALAQKYLQNFKLVVEDPFQNEYEFDFETALDPYGIVFQNITAGTYTISERNAEVPGFSLKTSPLLPYAASVTPSPAGEVLIQIANNYSPMQSQPPLPKTPQSPSQPGTSPVTGDMLQGFNMIIILLVVLTILACAVGILKRRDKIGEMP